MVEMMKVKINIQVVGRDQSDITLTRVHLALLGAVDGCSADTSFAKSIGACSTSKGMG
jgi:hypothetical protein